MPIWQTDGLFLKSHLEVQLEAELELARVEGGRRAAAVAAVVGALVDEVNVLEAGRGRRLVEAVEEVEALGDDFEAEALAEGDRARHAQVERLVGARESRVAAEAPGLELRRDDERAVGGDRGPVGVAGQVVVRVLVRQDVEGAARRHLEDRGDDEVGEEAAPAARPAPAAGRGQHAAEDEAVALVEERVGALQVEPGHVLREQQGLQVARIVNRVRPRVGGEELEVVGEAAAQLEVAGVVDRVAVRDLRVDVAEGGDEAGADERVRRRQHGVEDGGADRAARHGAREEVVRPRRAEEVGDEGLDDRPARGDDDEARYRPRDDIRAGGRRERDDGGRRRRERARAAAEVLDEGAVVRRVEVGRVRQVVRAREEPARLERHVLRELLFERHVGLVGVGVLEVRGDGQREGEERAEAGEGLVVEALAAELVVGAGGDARRAEARRA